ncbi:MAG: polyphosphate polymerase domain-containing protein [Pseudobutyrivibrio sp.]|nr:polyphosphate polymerase domain-containing protein [Pseudobutyrivibrio sp.]
MEWRHELKFLVSEETLERIKYRLMPIMELDAYHGDDGYLIRSVYFDDYEDSCVADNLAGVDKRSKYRIRTYEANSDFIRLEKKSKSNGLNKKDMWELTKDQCDAYLDGQAHLMIPQMQARHMIPKCIVEYHRLAFTYPTGNVRITFDTNLRGSKNISDFYKDRIDAVPALPVGQHILEIKYDEVLPRFIQESVDTGNLMQQSFSKYYYVRKTVG